jgi:WD40 repeat protein
VSSIAIFGTLKFPASRIISGSADGTVVLWEIASGAKLRTFQHDSGILQISPHLNTHVLSLTPTELLTWDAESGSCVARINILDTWRTALYSHRQLGSVDDEYYHSGAAAISESAEAINFLGEDLAVGMLTPKKKLLNTKLPNFRALSVSPDSSIIFCGHMIWDLAQGIFLYEYPETPNEFTTCMASSETEFRIANGTTCGVRTWCLDSKNESVNLTPEPERPMGCCGITFNSEFLFACYEDGTLCYFKNSQTPWWRDNNTYEDWGVADQWDQANWGGTEADDWGDAQAVPW